MDELPHKENQGVSLLSKKTKNAVPCNCPAPDPFDLAAVHVPPSPSPDPPPAIDPDGDNLQPDQAKTQERFISFLSTQAQFTV